MTLALWVVVSHPSIDNKMQHRKVPVAEAARISGVFGKQAFSDSGSFVTRPSNHVYTAPAKTRSHLSQPHDTEPLRAKHDRFMGFFVRSAFKPVLGRGPGDVMRVALFVQPAYANRRTRCRHQSDRMTRGTASISTVSPNPLFQDQGCRTRTSR